MVLGLSSKNKKGSSIHTDYLIHIHEIKPWPPSQSLRSLRSVVIHWENGERNSGSTNVVTPSLGSVIGEGKIEFSESFKLPVTLLRDVSTRNNKDSDSFLKNILEFNLYEPRRERTHQLLATATIDLADFGVIKDSLSITAPMNSKRSYRNTSQPVLFITIQPHERHQANSSPRNGSKDVCKNGSESVSALMNEENSEEAEIDSFTDDDISSHSSLTVSCSTLESHGGFSARTEEEEHERMNTDVKGSDHESSRTVQEESEPQEVVNRISSPIDLSSVFNLPVNTHVSVSDASISAQEDNANVFISNSVMDSVDESSMLDDGNGETNSRPFPLDDDLGNGSSQGSESNQDSIGESGGKSTVERSRIVKSVRSSLDISRSTSGCGVSNEQKEVKVHPKGNRDADMVIKIKNLESKVKKLEGELREAAAIEAALYTVVAEHGSSTSKVHAPARRLSRLYLQSPSSRRAAAAKSAVSGLVLVAKACGNDVPRLTFWLSNAVVLRAIISESGLEEELPVSVGPRTLRQKAEREIEKKRLPLKWKDSPPNKRDGERIGGWDNPSTFTLALEKVEAWIFTRVVESIWWQTFTPHMQSAARAFDKAIGSESRKNFRRTPSSVNQEQSDFSIELWKKAFRDACERLCPLRASGHECGCLPVTARLIMEQCVARLDVAMFNAILRDSDDSIPTDPVSDPIGDTRVLPVPSGKSSFGSGAQLKNAVGNWLRWLSDLFGIDEDDVENGEDDRSFKAFNLLNALSDLMMLPKDMLLNSSVRKEVCPGFGGPLIKRVLSNFEADEFCPDPLPNHLLEALENEERDKASWITDYPCTVPPPVYEAPSVPEIVSSSSVTRKANTSDDELDELTSPLPLLLPLPECPKALAFDSCIRYQLLRDLWMKGD
ncbi:PREDICTED: uncharacterized protein LOC104802377 [Tarenaya hassleriana]|uniref:uncharacterized protein LOC104802377 n=1 Tax=Tarenaya hassleriana TaxID=28532 RepID=UPI00053C9959|nr:PREDICTED: uncharacterized protein LOC104802377 [Tarenaya hassleriana]XP_010524263.1 PREDICTED: uncharacterized protein LOC104802377 [Tarenaya hassleriana]